jgi:DNA polymerase I-like protein with 3'-5' exonuclease and polymerase domains
MMAKIEKLNSRHESFEITIRKEVEMLSKKQFNDIMWTKDELKKTADKIESNSTKISDCEKFMQERYE